MAPTRASKRKASQSPVLSPQAVKVGRKPRNAISTTKESKAKPATERKADLIHLDTNFRHRPIVDTYVFGTGSMCELGLGPDSKNKTVKRPRLNPYLSQLDVIDVAVGGMHAAALTKEGRLYTWGVNDQGALGRDTTWDGGVVDADKGDDSDSEAENLNPKESTPSAVEHEQVFVKVAASDSLTVAIDDSGDIWAWGTFRCSDGILGFSAQSKIVNRPQRLVIKSKFVDIACGTDHVLALSTAGKVYAWGNGQQFQLGRRVVERTRLNGLVPREFGLKNIVAIGCGSYHSFAKDSSGRVFAWGLNQFGQCGIKMDEVGEDGAVVAVPQVVQALTDLDVTYISGGEHHSVAITKSGDLYVWGRLDACQLGLPRGNLPDTAEKDVSGKPRYIPQPTLLDFGENLKVRGIACGTHHNVAIDKDGRPWSWGFGESYQVGQGPPGEDIEVPTRIENTATQGKNMVLAGAGGQFSVLCAIRENDQKSNGVAA